jgi:hypothetical protein
MDQNTQNIPTHAETNDSMKAKSPFNRQRLLIIAVIIAVIAATAGVVVYLAWLNSPEKLLADSLHNTLALQQTTYKVAYRDGAKTPAGLTSLTVDGKYNKTQGYSLAATTVSATDKDETKLDAKIVFDPQGNGYYNYTNSSSTGTNSAQTQEFAAFLQILKGTGSSARWIKAPVDRSQQNTACALVGLQKMQNDTTVERALVAALVKSGGLAITTTAAAGDKVVYELKAGDSKVDALVQAYQSSDTYKTLSTCSPTGYSLTPVVAKQSTVRATVDKKARRVTAVTVTSGTVTIDLTVTPAQGVSIAVPKASEIMTTASVMSPQAQ